MTAERILIGQSCTASGPLATLNSEHLGGDDPYIDAANPCGGVHD